MPSFEKNDAAPLGLPESPHQPNHYELLGVQNFESDVQNIDSGYRRQVAKLKTLPSGSSSEGIVILLAELAEARDCLKDALLRSQYNALLAQKLAKQNQPTLRSARPPRAPISNGQSRQSNKLESEKPPTHRSGVSAGSLEECPTVAEKVGHVKAASSAAKVAGEYAAYVDQLKRNRHDTMAMTNNSVDDVSHDDLGSTNRRKTERALQLRQPSDTKESQTDRRWALGIQLKAALIAAALVIAIAATGVLPVRWFPVRWFQNPSEADERRNSSQFPMFENASPRQRPPIQNQKIELLPEVNSVDSFHVD